MKYYKRGENTNVLRDKLWDELKGGASLLYLKSPPYRKFPPMWDLSKLTNLHLGKILTFSISTNYKF